MSYLPPLLISLASFGQVDPSGDSPADALVPETPITRKIVDRFSVGDKVNGREFISTPSAFSPSDLMFADDDGDLATPEWCVKNGLLLETAYANKNLRLDNYDTSNSDLKSINNKLILGLPLTQADRKILEANLKIKTKDDKFRQLKEHEAKQEVENYIALKRNIQYEARVALLPEEERNNIDTVTEYLLRFPVGSFADFRKRSVDSSKHLTEKEFDEKRLSLLIKTIGVSDDYQASELGSASLTNLLQTIFEDIGMQNPNQTILRRALKDKIELSQVSTWTGEEGSENEIVNSIYDLVDSNNDITDKKETKKLLLKLVNQFLYPDQSEILETEKIGKGIKLPSVSLTDIPHENDSMTWLNYLNGIQEQVAGDDKVRVNKLIAKFVNFEELKQVDKQALKHILAIAGMKKSDIDLKANDIIAEYYADRKIFLTKDSAVENLDSFNLVPAELSRELMLNYISKKIFNQDAPDLARALRIAGFEPTKDLLTDLNLRIARDQAAKSSGVSLDGEYDRDVLWKNLNNDSLGSTVHANSKFKAKALTDREQVNKARGYLAISNSYQGRLNGYANHVQNYFDGLNGQGLDYKIKGFGNKDFQQALVKLYFSGKNYDIDMQAIFQNSSSMEDASKRLMVAIKERGLNFDPNFISDFSGLFAENSKAQEKVIDPNAFAGIFAGTTIEIENPGQEQKLSIQVSRIFSDLQIQNILDVNSSKPIKFKTDAKTKQISVDETTLPNELKTLFEALGINANILLDGKVGKAVNLKNADNTSKPVIFINASNLAKVLYSKFNKLELDYQASLTGDYKSRTEFNNLAAKRNELAKLFTANGIALYVEQSPMAIMPLEYFDDEMRAFFDNLAFFLKDAGEALKTQPAKPKVETTK